MCFAGGHRNDRTSTIPIVFCLLVFITGSPPSLARLRLSGRRRSFAGTALGLKLSGAGNPDMGQGGRRSIVSCAISSDGYPRSADLSWIAVAKWHCGTADWHTASRVLGPNGHLWRGAPTPGSFRLCSVLQSSAYALGIKERCTVTSSRPAVRRYWRRSDLGRATSSIRPDMIFGKDNWDIAR
jgi:hypothetical protein